MTSPGGDLTSANYQATLSTWLGDSGETLATSLVFTPSQSERSTGQAQQTQPITVCPARFVCLPVGRARHLERSKGRRNGVIILVVYIICRNKGNNID